MEKTLAELGFSPSETKIYLHLVKSGASYANKISAETKINRTNVYEAIDRLISKGVLSFIKRNKVKWFEAKPPESLLSLIKGKEEELEKAKQNLKEDISKMKMVPDNPSLEANIFIGKKGLRMIFEEILEAEKPIALIAATLQFRELFGPYFELWHKRRIEKGIPQRSIFPISLKSRLEKRDLLVYKFINDKYTNPTTTILYGNICIFVQWSKEPVAIKISNKEIASSHLNYFNILWNS